MPLPVSRRRRPQRALAGRAPDRGAASPARAATPDDPAVGPSGAWAALAAFQRALLNVAAGLGLVCLAVVAVCLALNLRATVVISGSMEPDIPVGAITFHRPTPVGEIAVGDVVTVPRPDDGTLVTHRVVATEPFGAGVKLTLKGDANPEPDPVPYDVTTAGKVVATVPVAGHLVLFVKRNPLTVVGVLLGLTGLACFPTGRYAGRPARREGPSHA
jgi:signal peptidase